MTTIVTKKPTLTLKPRVIDTTVTQTEKPIPPTERPKLTLGTKPAAAPKPDKSKPVVMNKTGLVALTELDQENIKAKHDRIDSTIKKLIELFPLTFFAPGVHYKPLKKGIYEDILRSGKLGDISKNTLKKALSYYVGNMKYQKGLAYHKFRINLNGKRSGEVTPEEKALAEKHRLDMIKAGQKKKKAEQKSYQNNNNTNTKPKYPAKESTAISSRPLVSTVPTITKKPTYPTTTKPVEVKVANTPTVIVKRKQINTSFTKP